MSKKPKISIVTPSYNQGQFVEETIKSILDQGYPNLEYVIADGASTDGTQEVLRRYESKVSRIISERDSGHGDALNKGFALTSGEIMGWLNSDDKYYPWTFEVVAEIFEKFPDVEWIVGLNSWWDLKGRLFQTQAIYKNKYDFLMGNFQWIQQESVFWRRSLWDKAGSRIDQNFSLMVDGDLWGRFFEHADLWHVDRVLGGYRVHGKNRAHLHMPKVLAEMDTVISRMANLITPDESRTIKRLRFLKNLGRPGRRVLRKVLGKPELFRSCGYKCLSFQGQDWVKTSRPFFD